MKGITRRSLLKVAAAGTVLPSLVTIAIAATSSDDSREEKTAPALSEEQLRRILIAYEPSHGTGVFEEKSPVYESEGRQQFWIRHDQNGGDTGYYTFITRTPSGLYGLGDVNIRVGDFSEKMLGKSALLTPDSALADRVFRQAYQVSGGQRKELLDLLI